MDRNFITKLQKGKEDVVGLQDQRKKAGTKQISKKSGSSRALNIRSAIYSVVIRIYRDSRVFRWNIFPYRDDTEVRPVRGVWSRGRSDEER